MFGLYRRHEEDCRFRKKGVRHIKCSCPVWMDGYDEHARRQRRSLNTRSWSQAQDRLERYEESGQLPAPIDRTPTVEAAVQSFLADCRARDLKPSTLTSYQRRLAYLAIYFSGKKLSELTLEALTVYRSGRAAAAPGSTVLELQLLRTFFAFALARKWIPENPARSLKAPKVKRVPTLPFSPDEVQRIIGACDTLDPKRPDRAPRTRAQAKALVLTLLYTGFRISDAVQLKRSAVNWETGQLMIRVMKTGVNLYIRLPSGALDALKALPEESPYFFWSGKGKFTGAITNAWIKLSAVFKNAKIEGGHPHRFRDTFSVSLLDNGVDMHTVQLLLGHSSIKTTEKHYAPFVRSSQRILDEAVSTLHFESTPDRKPPVDSQQDAGRNPKSNVLPFSRSKRA